MDRLWLFRLLGWAIGCTHARGKGTAGRFLSHFGSQCYLATFEDSQITRIPTDGVEI
jgi:hypothetical protein